MDDRICLQGDWIDGIELCFPYPSPFVIRDENVHPGPVVDVRLLRSWQQADEDQRRPTAGEANRRDSDQCGGMVLVGGLGAVGVENAWGDEHEDVHGEPGQRQPCVLLVSDQAGETSRLDKEDNSKPSTRPQEKPRSVDRHGDIRQRVEVARIPANNVEVLIVPLVCNNMHIKRRQPPGSIFAELRYLALVRDDGVREEAQHRQY